MPTTSFSPSTSERAPEVNLSPDETMERDPARVLSRPLRWLSENGAALSSSNDFVARNGLPLAKYRRF